MIVILKIKFKNYNQITQKLESFSMRKPKREVSHFEIFLSQESWYFAIGFAMKF